MSDALAVQNLHTTHKYTKNAIESAAIAIKAGCNMEITSNNNVYINQKEAIKSGNLTEIEIRENIKPLFLARMRLGEFDPPQLNPYNSINMTVVQSAEHRELAIQTAIMSFVLLKNKKNILPIITKKKFKKIAVSITFGTLLRELQNQLYQRTL